MKKILLVLVIAACAVHVNAQAGTPDLTFGVQGIMTPSFPGYSIGFQAMALQADGKFVVVGSIGSPQTRWAVMRFNTNGTTDNSFSDDGLTVIDLGSIGNPTDVAIQADGKIVVIGTASPFTHDFAVVRLLPNGSLDNYFGDGGHVYTDFSYSYDTPNKLAIQEDGKIVVMGTTTISIFGPYGIGYAFARYNRNGSLDDTFSGDGKNVYVFSANDRPRTLAIQADGKIVFGGTDDYDNSQGYTNFFVSRLNSNGIRDFSFAGGNVYTLIDFNGYGDFANAMTLQPDGKIIIAGSTVNGAAGSDLAIARLTANGIMDNSFSGDGKLTLNLGSNYEGLAAVALQPDGKIIAGGFMYYTNSEGDAVLARFSPEGVPDNSFSGDGVVISNLLGGTNFVNDLAVNNGRVYALGNSSVGGGFIAAFLLESTTVNFSCPTNRILHTDPGVCSAKVNFLDPTGVPAGATLTYTLSGATTGSGNGSASGRIFNKGVTTVNYFTSNPASDCQFTVTIVDMEAPTASYPVVNKYCYAEWIAVTPLEVTDNCGIQSISYRITTPFSLAVRTGTGADVSGPFKAGNNYVTWTITDVSGNVKTVNAIIEVYEPIRLEIPDVQVLSNGVEKNTVYPGYDPAAKITLQVVSAGGVTRNHSYKWSTGATTPSITVNPLVPTNYTVTVTDQAGCSRTASKFVNVVDVRCGNKLNKVELCHVPRGNPSNSHSICINAADVAGHLSHGDYLGGCKAALLTGKPGVETLTEALSGPTLSAYPNPSSREFNIVFRSTSSLKVEVVVYDASGRVIERKVVLPNSVWKLGAGYRPGVYLVRAIQGETVSTLRLVRQSE